MTSPTDGYQVGNAFIQMLPSFRTFHQRTAAQLARVGDVHVNVEPEVSPRALTAVAARMDERLSKTPVVKRVELDQRAFDAQLALLAARRDALKLRIDADISAALAKIAELERRRGTTTINVDAEIVKAQAKIKALEAQRDTIDIQVDVDTDKAERKLNQVEQHLKRINNNQTDINMEASDASRAVAVLGLVTAGLAVVGQLAPAAAAAIAAIPAALAGAAQGVGAVVAGFSGIGGAVKALQALEDEGASKAGDNAQKRISSANRVASAQSSLDRALEQADRAAIDGARQVQDAQEALAQAEVNAVRRVEDAERALTAAQQTARDAQEALSRARKDAAENLDDLNRSVKGAALDEQGAVLALAKANERLEAARAANVGGPQMADIELEAAQAAQALDEVRDRYGDLRDEADAANKAGVEGSQEVVAAQRQNADATLRVQGAERDLAQTRADSARDVAKAQERVAQAQLQASQSATDASRAVADAQRSLAEASLNAGDAGSAAMDKLAVSMAKLSPAGQQFALFLQNSVKPALQGLTQAVQGEMLPRVQAAFQMLLTLAPQVTQAFAETGAVIGDLAIKGADMVTSGPWRADFATIMARNNRVLGDMGNAGLSALDAVRNLTVASGPLVEALAASTEGYLTQFAAWLQGKRDSGELATWFQEMSVRIREALTTFGQLASGVFDVLQALAPLGHVILQIVGPFVQWVGAMLEANPVLSTVIALGILGASTFVSLFRTIGGLTQAFRTSSGVYNNIKDSLLGVQKATEGATAATQQHADTTANAGTKLAQTGGLVGKFRSGLDSVKDAYTSGSASARTWAENTSSSLGRVTSDLSNKLVPAVSYSLDGLNKFQPAAGRASESLRSFSSTASSGLSQVSRVSVLGADTLRSWSPVATAASGTLRTMTSAASTAFSGVASTVGGTVAAVGKGISGIASGLVGALGGPFGIAIAGATIGLGLLASAQADAAKKAAEHKAQVQGLTDALIESNGAIDENVNKQIQLALKERSVDDNARDLNLSVGAMTQAIARGGQAATNFEQDMFGVAEQLAKSKGLPAEFSDELTDLANQVYITGGQASDFKFKIDELGHAYQMQTGATDEATDAFKTQIAEFLDLVGGYSNAKGDFASATQDQQDIARAQEDAASATENHFNNLKKLNDAILASINKDVAHRQNLNSLEEAHNRVAEVLANEHHTTEELTAAQLAEEQAALQVIASAGALAAATTTATTPAGKLKDEMIAQAQAAADVANKWQGDIPASLLTYMTSVGVAKDATGQWIVKIDEVPGTVPTTAVFDDTNARAGVENYGAWLKQYFGDLLGQDIPGYTPQPGTNGPTTLGGILGLPGHALGGIDIPAYAAGGIRPMSGKVANIVPPRQPRLIGDRMQGSEAFIPLNRDPRSVAILAEAAQQMGFALLPLAFGAVLAMADGGVTQAGTPAAASGGAAALAVDAGSVEMFTAAVQQLVAAGLAPLAGEINTVTVPALVLLEQHAGVAAVASVTALAGLLPPLRDSFNVAAAVISAAWLASTQASQAGVTAIGGYLATLRYGLAATRDAMSATADWAVAQFGRVRAAAADPIRWVLQNPINAGLVAGWNKLDADFAMGKAITPVPIPFAEGGRVPGVGPGDKVKAMLTPGEIVFDRQAIANLGGVAAVERWRKMARAGLVGPHERLGGEPGDAAARLKLMREVPLDGLGFAYGGVQPHVAAAGQEIEEKFGRLPGGIGGVGSRPNVSDHPLGLALDFMTMTDVPLGNRIAAYLIANAQRLAVKYLIWQQKFNDGAGWSGMEDRGSPTANHMDHVHSSFLRLGQLGRPFSGDGAALDPAAYFADARQMIGQVPALFPGNQAAARAAAVATQAVDGAVQRADFLSMQGGTAGNVESWRPMVNQALHMLGLPAGWADVTLSRMNKESGGNPRAINLWDSNAKAGTPSKGLMQVIDPTFRTYRDPRAPDDIWNPLANILASARYAMSRYGSLPAGYGRPGGYDDGGLLPPGYSTVYNGLSRPEMVLTGNQWGALFSLAAQNTSGGGDFTGNLYLSSGEFLGAVEGVIERSNTESGRVLARRTR